MTIHCRLSVEKPSAFCAEGSAIVTIVASSTTISCATLSRARTAHRFGSAVAGLPAGALTAAIPAMVGDDRAVDRVRDNGAVTDAAGRLSGRVCVITGAAGGVGRATARRLSQEGATVVGVDLAEHAVGELCLQADVTDEAHVRDLYARVRDELGRIDVLFNNAGVNDPRDGSALDTSTRDLKPRADGEPHERLLVLQAQDSAPAGQPARATCTCRWDASVAPTR